MEPFIIHNFYLDIIDTYENERILVEEVAQAGALKLIYDGGDDLYQPMMPSQLTFNMLANEAIDAFFLHLLTGDEKRYRVELHNIDEEETDTLLWQGYILPDLYSEPYKNGALFVTFTAIDMLASLKGKTFKPWFYNSKINLPVLLGYILAETGLHQEIYVFQSLVNISHEAYEWRKLNLDLKPYFDGKKYTDLYEILEDILTAQGMQIMSYRGKWFLQGITRRGDLMGVAEVYDADGAFLRTETVERAAVYPLLSATPPNITAETPWKKVSLNFETDSPANLFPEDVVKKQYFSSRYLYDRHMITNGNLTEIMGYWKRVGAPMCDLITDSEVNFGYRKKTNLEPEFYNLPEASALVNYFECHQKPFVLANRKYELELEVLVQHVFSGPNDDFDMYLAQGAFNRVLTFQMFCDGAEIMSNRPSYAQAGLFEFTRESRGNPGGFVYIGIYKLKKEFVVPVSGEITFRFLPPLDQITSYGLVSFDVRPEVLKINVVEDLAGLESAVAVRDINYTKELDIDVALTCTVDTSVQNSFGIGTMAADQFSTIDFGTPQVFYDHHYYLPSTDIQLILYRWPISELLQTIIFHADMQRSLFLQKVSGEQVHYYSVYTGWYFNVPQMVAYTGFIADPDGVPQLPKDFLELPVPVAGDTLYIMNSVYPAEDNDKRELWKIYGFEDDSANTYMKTLAHACHAVRPDVCFSIEATALELIFPLQLVYFFYNNAGRYFLPTRIEMDLSEGKTGLTMKEVKLQEITDITFE